ncbi:MAG: DUF1501 domain-containing protein [Planctomycetota bacterium]
MNIDRRRFLSGLAALPLCRAVDWHAPPPQARALILVWLDGGMSHIDMFDGKPEASPDVRGDLGSVPANLDGVFFGEGLQRLAQRMDRMVLFRAVTHGEGVHERASEYLLTGHRPSAVLAQPCFGAVHAMGRDPLAMPAFLAVPDAPPHGGRGFLDARFAPFELGGDPGRPEYRVHHLTPDPAHTRRQAWRERLDALDTARSVSERARDDFVREARALSLDGEVRQWFDLGAEDARMRSTYGRHRLGQSCLLARRLVQGGARCVLVRDDGWDHHRDIRRALTYGFPPKYEAVDQAISALVDDLDELGLAERVVVMVASEFGRTPRLNPAGGRDHWPRAQSVLAFGGGFARGAVVGRTDRKGEEPVDGATTPADLHATLVRALGGDVEQVIETADGRPYPVVERGGAPVAAALRGPR